MELTYTDPPSKSSLGLLITWFMVFPLLVFASQYGFSFEHSGLNTLSGSASLGLQSSASNNADNALLRAQSLSVYLLCILCMFSYSRQIVGDLLLRNPLVLCLPILCFTSALWSRDPQHTLIASTYLAIDICFVAYLLRRFSTEDIMRLLLSGRLRGGGR